MSPGAGAIASPIGVVIDHQALLNPNPKQSALSPTVGHSEHEDNRALIVLLVCLFVAPVGFGVTITVLPYFAESIHGLSGLDQKRVAFHVGILTALYSLGQLVASPTIGRIGDRIGRRPVLLVGLIGMAVTQSLFGFVTSLPMLYLLRVIGGLAAACTLTTASAYIADSTSVRDRARGMAWFGTAVSLGFVAGPALGGALSGDGLSTQLWGLTLNSLSLPFLVAGLLTGVVAIVAWKYVPESHNISNTEITAVQHDIRADKRPTLHTLLGLVAVAQFGLAAFEGTFVLYASKHVGLSQGQAGLAFLVCGGVMAVLQPLVVGRLHATSLPLLQITLGFVLMGLGILGVGVAPTFATELVFIALLAIGGSFLIPNLSALVSLRGDGHVGSAVGWKDSAGSLGQTAGPILGGALVSLWPISPFLISGSLLVVVGLGVARTTRRERQYTP